MSDELLPYFDLELKYLRLLGAEFAQKYGKIAARLRLSPDECQDPHVERLIQAVAYLNARIRHKLDDDYPELTDALLGVLYPHYQQPVPSMAVVQFHFDRTQGELTTGYDIPAGARLQTEPVDGERLEYRTCYPVTLWPMAMTAAALRGRPFHAPAVGRASQAASVLRISLATLADALSFKQLDLRTLRLFLHGTSAPPLYELLFQHAIQVVLARSPRDPGALVLSPECLQPVGFARDEGMIPYSPRSFLGYRLLTEYFTFPHKFLFADVTGLESQRLASFGRELEIYVYFNRSAPDLERDVSPDTLRLGCAPIVNLFQKQAEPIALTHTQTQYRVVPDARRPLAEEVFSIERVSASYPGETEAVEYQPFYSFKHASADSSQETFWHATRRPAASDEGTAADAGQEVFLALTDLDFRTLEPADGTLSIDITCLNRDMPQHLPFGGGRPELELIEGGGPVESIECLTPPTPTRRPEVRHAAMWRIMSHLSLNHLSLADEEGGLDALREILRLYVPENAEKLRQEIEGIVQLRSRRVAGRVTGTFVAVVRGVEIELLLDEQAFPAKGAYLFASVLERFLAMYCSLNSFTRLVATTKQRKDALTPWRWPNRAGEKLLL